MANKKYIQLYIGEDGEQLDVDLTQSKCELVFQVDNGDVNGGYAQKEFPLTVNKRLLAYMQRDNNDIKRRLCNLFVNGIPVFSGIAQFKTGTEKGRNYDTIQTKANLNIFQDNASWYPQAKLLDLRTILDNYLTGFVYDVTTIANGMTYDLARGQNLGFGIVKYKDFADKNIISIDEFTPLVFIDKLVEQVFKALGYTVKSDFFDLNSSAGSHFGTRLVMPVQILNLDSDICTLYSAYVKASTTPDVTGLTNYILPCNVDSSLPYYDKRDRYNAATYKYSAPYAGTYSCTLKLKVKIYSALNVNTWNEETFQMYLYKGSSIIYSMFPKFTVRNSDPTETISGGIYYYKEFGMILSYDATLAAGDVNSELYWKMVGYNSTDPTDPAFRVLFTKIEAEYTPTDVFLTFGNTIKFSDLYPSAIYVDSFINGLAHLFNLKFSTNVQARQVTIEPSDNWLDTWVDYSGASPVVHSELREGFYRQNIENWANKIDQSIDVEIIRQLSPNNQQILDYKSDNADATANYLSGIVEPFLGGALYNIGEDIFNKGQDIQTNSLFAATLMFQATRIGVQYAQPSGYTLHGTPPTPIIPFAQNKNYLTDDVATDQSRMELRILYFEGIRGYEGGGIYRYPDGIVKVNYHDGINNDAATWMPALWSCNYNASDIVSGTGIAADMSLLFHDTVINGRTHVGLMRRFYGAELARNRKAIQKRFAVRLDDMDIMNLDFRNYVEINGKWYIKKIVDGYDVMNERSTKVNLIEAAFDYDTTKQTAPDKQNFIIENV